MNRLILVAAAGIAIASLQAASVSDVMARQRYPWNGMVDIDYTITGENAERLSVSVRVKDVETGRIYAPMNFLQEPSAEPGRHRMTWDTAADQLDLVSSNVEITVALCSRDYMVVDLSGGQDAEHWSVSYLSAEPEGGWSDEYKTKKLVLRRIPAGLEPLGRYTITRDFYAGVFELTSGQMSRMMSDGGSNGTVPAYVGSGERARGTTAEEIDVQVGEDSLMGRLCAKTGLDGFDVPTSAQWEYACRAGTRTKYNNGTDDLGGLAKVAWIWKTPVSARSEHPVGLKLPNKWGLYDMHGNHAELCLSCGNTDGGDIIGYAETEDPAWEGGYCTLGGNWRQDYSDCKVGRVSGLSNYSGVRVFFVPTQDTSFDSVCTQRATMIDTRAGKGPIETDHAEDIMYSNLWSGETDAMVEVAVNGEALNAMVGEGSYSWPLPSKSGYYVLTHTMKKDGTQVGETLTAAFVVALHEIEVPSGGLSKFDAEHVYDREGHTINTQSLFAVTMPGSTPSFSFSLSEAGPWQAEPFVYTNVGEFVCWYKISATNYNDFVHQAKLTITENIIGDVSVKNRYPWNGCIDIDCFVNGSSDEDLAFVTVSAVDLTSGTNLPVKSLSTDGRLWSEGCMVKRGKNRITWNADVDMPDCLVTNVALDIHVSRGAPYKVIDLTGGIASNKWVCKSSYTMPKEEGIKTNKIVLRKIPSGMDVFGRYSISKDFYLGVYEVTWGQYKLATDGSTSGGLGPMLGMSTSSFRDAYKHY